MGRNRKYRYFVGDFETTVYKGQTDTRVWASAIVEFWSEDVEIYHNIEDTIDRLKTLKSNLIIYYHNLRFDGSFIVSHFLEQGLKQGIEKIGKEEFDIKFKDKNKLENNEFIYSISDKGKWYSITLKVNNYLIEFYDSLKLLPFSVKEIGKSFATKHKKLDMEYEGLRFPGCAITEEEKHYIANDVLVVKEALEIMFSEGHKKMTIGACCLSEYKSIVGKNFYEEYFPDLTIIHIDKNRHKYKNAEQWIRKSYKGGWCYLVKGKENKVYRNGLTADVNSLYPSVMHSESGCRYPVGAPKFWTGNFIPPEALEQNMYYFIRIKTRFYIKEGMLPFIQIKGNFLYKPTEVLESSDIFLKSQNRYVSQYKDENGEIRSTTVEMTLTMTEYKLILDHYDLVDFEILDGCYFVSEIGIFDEYIDKYKLIKMTSVGARRTLAKLFLNNLYGKMASSTDSSFKYCYLNEDGVLSYVGIQENNKKAGFIAVGSAITSYARNFTIRHAQKNYHGKNSRGFIYADTDSIHCDIKESELTGLKIHETNFNSWSIESNWDMAIFVRQKTYIEHIKEDNYYDIKCAGMPDRCKELFRFTLENKKEEDLTEDEKRIIKTEEQRKFLKTSRTINDFKIGLKVPGKLMPKRIKGGTLLTEGWYELRK